MACSVMDTQQDEIRGPNCRKCMNRTGGEAMTNEFTEVSRQNNEVFDAGALARLGIYVYVLQDPASQRVFYVRKGGGRDANASNQRVLDHFDEAENWLKDPSVIPYNMEKIRSIVAIWARGEAVQWFIVRHNLRDADEALNVEAALIDTLSLSLNGPLDNIQSRHRASLHGLLAPGSIATLNSPLINPDVSLPAILIFPIKRALATKIPYEAVRRYWSASEQVRQTPSVAVGVADGISHIVVNIARWDPVPELDGKWEFSGTIDYDSPLLGKNFSNVIAPAMGYWMRGNYIAVEFNGQGSFRILRGSRDKAASYPCA